MQGRFVEIKNRDAWATIRGFIYQLDLTILQWIDLRDNQILELKRGEDIDVITAGLASTEPSRELEQVKYREAAFSLNQEGVLEILFNFFQHLSNNPGPGQGRWSK